MWTAFSRHAEVASSLWRQPPDDSILDLGTAASAALPGSTRDTPGDPMRPTLLLIVPALLACAKSDDSAAARDTSTPTAATAPAALRASDVSGTWNGTTMAQGSDSVISRWTLMNDTDTTGKLIRATTGDTVPFRVTFSGDSMVAVSQPYASTRAANAPRVIFNSTGRLQDGKLVGTVFYTSATKADSVLSRARFEATRAP